MGLLSCGFSRWYTIFPLVITYLLTARSDLRCWFKRLMVLNVCHLQSQTLRMLKKIRFTPTCKLISHRKGDIWCIVVNRIKDKENFYFSSASIVKMSTTSSSANLLEISNSKCVDITKNMLKTVKLCRL